jgi:hypothetical protein
MHELERSLRLPVLEVCEWLQSRNPEGAAATLQRWRAILKQAKDLAEVLYIEESDSSFADERDCEFGEDTETSLRQSLLEWACELRLSSWQTESEAQTFRRLERERLLSLVRNPWTAEGDRTPGQSVKMWWADLLDRTGGNKYSDQSPSGMGFDFSDPRSVADFFETLRYGLALYDLFRMDVRIEEQVGIASLALHTNAGSVESSVTSDPVDIEQGTGTPEASGPGLVLDTGRREAFWGDSAIRIGAHGDFDALLALARADGAIVDHLTLHLEIRPNDQTMTTVVTLDAATQQEKDAVSAINRALNDVGCPLRIRAVRTKGYKLSLGDVSVKVV